MNTVRIQEIAAFCQGTVIPEKLADAYVRSVEIDSRKITLGSLFVPIIGERSDGHDFIEQAFEHGAVCALCDQNHAAAHAEKLPYGKSLIVVEDTASTLEYIAEGYRQKFDIPVVGVTGSVGKTSCKDFTAAALTGKFKVLKTQGNHNNNIGMPLTLFELDETYQAAVMEMGMDHFGEITRLSRTARPVVGIITNIGISHMENLGSREGILKAKMEIADYLNPNGVLFLNGDDERLYSLKGKRSEHIEYFGWGEQNDGRILSAELTAEGNLHFVGVYQGKTWNTVVATPGKHMAMNIMPAIMTGCFLGLSEEEICAGLATYHQADGRLNIHQVSGRTIIDDSYNASPDSMKGALETLSALPGEGRRIAILGDMYELGEAEESGHLETGAFAASVPNLTALWTVGEKGRMIYDGAADLANKQHFDTPDTLIEALPGLLQPNDMIIVKASNGLKLSRVVDFLCKEGEDHV